MTVLKSFPYDNMPVYNYETEKYEDDREYPANVFAGYFRKFLSNGVYIGDYKNYGENSMKVILNNGLTVKVCAGCGIIEGVDYELENDMYITLERPANGIRVDRIIVRMDATLSVRESQLDVLKGNEAIPAELTRNDNVYEICIAEITVSANKNIEINDIVDKRLDKTLCGRVNSLITVDDLTETLKNKITPVGAGFDYYGQNAPENFMFADGRELSRIEYNELFKVIGTIYGAGDGQNTFNIPDKRERMSLTISNIYNQLGMKGGFKDAQVIKHSHKFSGIKESHNHDSIPNVHPSAQEAKGYGLAIPNEGGQAFTDRIAIFQSDYQTKSTSSKELTPKGNISEEGVDGQGKNMPPFLVCHYIIKVK